MRIWTRIDSASRAELIYATQLEAVLLESIRVG
jgi:hypothetical protein